MERNYKNKILLLIRRNLRFLDRIKMSETENFRVPTIVIIELKGIIKYIGVCYISSSTHCILLHNIIRVPLYNVY